MRGTSGLAALADRPYSLHAGCLLADPARGMAPGAARTASKRNKAAMDPRATAQAEQQAVSSPFHAECCALCDGEQGKGRKPSLATSLADQKYVCLAGKPLHLQDGARLARHRLQCRVLAAPAVRQDGTIERRCQLAAVARQQEVPCEWRVGMGVWMGGRHAGQF